MVGEKFFIENKPQKNWKIWKSTFLGFTDCGRLDKFNLGKMSHIVKYIKVWEDIAWL